MAVPSILRRSWRLMPPILGVLLIALGAAVLLGWVTRETSLIQIRPEFAPMQGNSALCFIACGVALLLTGTRLRRVCAALGAGVALLSLMILSQDLFGVDLGVDQLLFNHTVASPSAYPGATGRMAPNTALAFVLAGFGFLILHRQAFAGALLGALVFTLGAFASLGYSTGVPWAFAWREFTPMALHTSLGLSLLGLALVLASFRQRQARGVGGVLWLPYLAGVTAVLAGILIWNAMRIQELGSVRGSTGLPEVALFGSLLAAFGLTLAVQLAEMARLRAQRFEVAVQERTAELERALAALEAENAERRRSEETLQRTQQMDRLLAAELDVEKVVQAVTDAATELTGAAFGAFFYNVTNERGESYMLYTLSGAPIEAFSSFPTPRKTQIFGPTFNGQAAVRLDDVTQDPRYGKNAPYHGLPPGHLPVVSYLAVPVVSRSGTVWGGLFFGHPEPAVFSDREEQIAVGLAAQAAIALDNARLYEAERRARSEAQAASAAKDRFLAMLGHELRNPLGSIRTALEVLQLRREDHQTRERMGALISRQVDHLSRLVDDLLDVSRIERGKLTLQPERLDLTRLLEELLELERKAVESSGLHFVARLPAAPVWVDADPTRLSQVVRNLIDNAIKFTDAGGRIEVELASADQGEWAALTVTDTGCGLDQENLTEVFEPFTQTDQSLDRSIGGLGLGLPLVKGLVEAHGGRVEAESDGRGRGTRVIVELPVQEAPPERQRQRERGDPIGQPSLDGSSRMRPRAQDR